MGSQPGQRGELHWEVGRQTVWAQLRTVIKLRLSQLEGTSEVSSPPPHLIMGETEVSGSWTCSWPTKGQYRAQIRTLISALESDALLFLVSSKCTGDLRNLGNRPGVPTPGSPCPLSLPKAQSFHPLGRLVPWPWLRPQPRRSESVESSGGCVPGLPGPRSPLAFLILTGIRPQPRAECLSRRNWNAGRKRGWEGWGGGTYGGWFLAPLPFPSFSLLN